MAIKKRYSRIFLVVSILFGLFGLFVTIGFIVSYSGKSLAADPPHQDSTDTGWCTKCHTPHSTLGTSYGVLARVQGNANLCQSCHNTGGRATNKPFINQDQSALGAEVRNTKGWSHRWDSGVGGYVDSYSVSTGTTGRIISGLASGNSADTFVGTTPRIYEIRVVTTGDVTGAAGGARFDWRWSQNRGGDWSAYQAGQLMTTSGANLNPGALQNGDIKASFLNVSSPSFAGTSDVFRVYVRPEITFPQNSALRARMFKDPNAPDDTFRKVSCSTCHNQHSQASATSDPTSDTSYTSGSTNNRHFQRMRNMTDSMCRDCHSVRNIQSATVWNNGNNLSHPIGLSINSIPVVTPFHTVPFEPVVSTTLQTEYSYKGAATASASNTSTTLVDSGKSFAAGVITKIIRFTSGTSKDITRTVNTQTPISVSWSAALSQQVTTRDKYEIDADGNLSNSLRFYNPDTGFPSFTAGQVLCLSCHNIHWADSSDTTADIP